jgi:DNA invertase Pin-like site-specific DNA recombinase
MQKSVYRTGERRPRPAGRGFARLLAGINPGDEVMVTRLDRLARSTGDRLNTLRRSPPRKPVSNHLATHEPTPGHRTSG